MTCPFCGSTFVDAEFVDVGVGGRGVQVAPYDCGDCEAQQMNPYSDNSRASEREKRRGWWMGREMASRYAALDKRRRIAARLAEVQRRTEYVGVPCTYCTDDCFGDGGPEYMDTKIAVCYSCAELACRP